ncbi:MAG: hypothetical protein L6461_21320 [Anaerolineae bacterium]|nr:hypothetical protein [Anaerolineae bacterium]
MSKLPSDPPIRFIPAKCPNCAGELRIPENREAVKCMYCGHDILIHDKNRFTIETKFNVERILDLAKTAEKSRNYGEAYQYYSQVLEQDSNIASAWIGKGISAGWQSSDHTPRINEAINCVKKGLELDSNESSSAAIRLIRIISSYTIGLEKFFTNRIVTETRPPGVILDPVMSGFVIASRRSTAKEKANNEFWKIHRPIILQGLTFSWQISNDIEVAKRLYKTLNTVLTSDFLSKEIKISFKKSLDTVLAEIREKFPNLPAPKEGGDCFIATATMERDDHPYVFLLRKFRDKELSQSKFGAFFIKLYYLYSPPIAQLIKTNLILRKISFFVIVKPGVFIASKILSMNQDID